MSKLHSEIRLVVSRELTGDRWGMEEVMGIVGREINARERSSASASAAHSQKTRFQRIPLTAVQDIFPASLREEKVGWDDPLTG